MAQDGPRGTGLDSKALGDVWRVESISFEKNDCRVEGETVGASVSGVTSEASTASSGGGMTRLELAMVVGAEGEKQADLSFEECHGDRPWV